MAKVNHLLFLIFALCFGSNCFCQINDKDRLALFSLRVGSVAKLDSPLAYRFIELVPKQTKKIEKILEDSQKESKRIRAGATSVSSKLASLEKLRENQNSEIESVLLPHQIERVALLDDYFLLLREGFAVSVVNGSIASRLQLDVNTRTKLKEKSESVLEEYRKSVALAQKKAIQEIAKAVPENKRKRLNKLLDPMLAGDGSLWGIDDAMLDLSKPSGVVVIPRLEPLKDRD